MRILGIEMTHPTPRALRNVALFIVAATGIVLGLNFVGLMPDHLVWPSVLALAVGSILVSFGISVARDGLRALLIVIGIGTFLYILLVG